MTQRHYQTIWHLQAAQLQMINWQIHQQQQLAAWQANLHQALHDTEQMSKRVGATLAHDVFSAAALARSWMKRVSGMGPQSFNDFHAKRAWSDAIGILDGAARAAMNDARTGQKVDAYLDLMDRLAAFHAKMGGEAEPYVAEFRRRLANTSEGKGLAVGAGVAGFLGLACMPGEQGRGLGVMLLIAAGGCVAVYLSGREKWVAAKRNLMAAEAYANEYHQFQTDPACGAWLRQVWADHRLLFEAPIPEAPPPSSHSSQVYVERKVVERQLVVVRCRFCKQLTPVDQPSCEHCGSPGFGSSQ